MPTNRTPISRPPRSRITPEASALFERVLKIQAYDDEQFWEEDGGKRREYLDISSRLHQALGLRVFEPSPLDCFGDAPEWEGNPHLWRKAAELRAALIASTDERWVDECS